MKYGTKRNTLSALPGLGLCSLSVAALGFLSVKHCAQAQGVLASGPAVSITPPAVRQLQSGDMDVFPPEGTSATDLGPPFHLGPVGIRPHVFYRFSYGDGIPAGVSNYVSTAIQELSPGVLLGIGSHWNLDYTPTWRLYSKTNFADTLDQSVRLTGGGAYEDWIFGLSQDYSLTSQPEIDTATQTTVETFNTALTGSYRFNSKLWTDLSLNQSFVSAEHYSSYRQWSTEDWLNYEFWTKFNGAIGGTLGYVSSSGTNSDMLFERLQARLDWRATEKIGIHLRGGFEERQFLDDNEGSLFNPLAGVTIQYEPFEFTKVSLNFDRVVTASYSQGPASESTEIMGNLNQRLLGVMFLDLGGGYHMIKYVGTVSRTDDFYVLNARLNFPVLKRGNVVLFYQYSDNSSSEAGFTFLSRQAGVELSYRY